MSGAGASGKETDTQFSIKTTIQPRPFPLKQPPRVFADSADLFADLQSFLDGGDAGAEDPALLLGGGADADFGLGLGSSLTGVFGEGEATQAAEPATAQDEYPRASDAGEEARQDGSTGQGDEGAPSGAAPDMLNVAGYLLDDEDAPDSPAVPVSVPVEAHQQPVAGQSAAALEHGATVHDEPLAYSHPQRMPVDMIPVHPGAPATTLVFRSRPPVRMSGKAMLPKDVGHVVNMHYRQLQQRDPVSDDFYANALRVRRAHRILRAHRQNPHIPPPPQEALQMPLPAPAVVEAASTVQQLLRQAAKRASDWASAHHVLGRHRHKALGAKPQMALGAASIGPSSGAGEEPGAQAAHDERSAVYSARFAIEHGHSVLAALAESQLQRAALLNRQPPPGEAEVKGAGTAVEAARLGVARAIGAASGVGSLGASTGGEGEGEGASGPDGDADAKLLLLASLPKGKRLLARAGAQLRPHDLCGLVRACFRRLVFVVASQVAGWESEAADGELSDRLCQWVQGAVVPGRDGNPMGQGARSGLSLCVDWLQALADNTDSAVLAELFAHPKGQAAMSALLGRGEAERQRSEAEGPTGGPPSAGAQFPPCPAPSKEDLAAWKTVTEALDRAITEASGPGPQG